MGRDEIKLSGKDLDLAREALARWFDSQDIYGATATFIMAQLIAQFSYARATQIYFEQKLNKLFSPKACVVPKDEIIKDDIYTIEDVISSTVVCLQEEDA
jgi:hypothetical protein